MADRNAELKRRGAVSPSFQAIIAAIRRARRSNKNKEWIPYAERAPLSEEAKAVLGGREPEEGQLEWQYRAFRHLEETPDVPPRRKSGREGREGRGGSGAGAPLGSGERFRALVAKLRARGGVENPEALAAAIGRKKYGKKRFQALSVAGRKRRRRGR